MYQFVRLTINDIDRISSLTDVGLRRTPTVNSVYTERAVCNSYVRLDTLIDLLNVIT